MSSEREPSRLATWTGIVLTVLVLYVLSSGPVIATCFWLRESTGRDEFYLALYLYYPLAVFGHRSPTMVYIEWWVKFFGTVGPG